MMPMMGAMGGMGGRPGMMDPDALGDQMGGGMMPPMPTLQPGMDPAMIAAMQGPQTMAGQPMDPNILEAIIQMLGPNGGPGGTLGAPVGPGGIPASPAPPGQGAAMTPWQQALMGSGGSSGGMGGAAGIRGLPPGGGGY